MKTLRIILSAAVVGVLVLGTASQAAAQQQEKMTLEEWQAQLDACNAREQAASARIAELDRQIADLRQQISGVDRQIEQVRNDIRGLNQQVSSTQGELTQVQGELERVRFPDSYEVVRGDCLWNIAKKDYIYNDPFQWPRIYEANKDKIKDPDLIYPRQVFRIIRP
jgi:nucleoid-associated protein YgaU